MPARGRRREIGILWMTTRARWRRCLIFFEQPGLLLLDVGVGRQFDEAKIRSRPHGVLERAAAAAAGQIAYGGRRLFDGESPPSARRAVILRVSSCTNIRA